MKMEKRQYRIGDLSKELKVKKFVIRFWEKELGIMPDRSPGGQRFYEEKDFETFKQIKHLLYDKKFTIAGAKTELQNNKKNTFSTKVIASKKTNSFESENKVSRELQEKIISLKKQLLKLRELL
jgi:DNA-binding transcriptional MerR regulator